MRNKKKEKKAIQDNLDDEQKEHLKIQDNKKKRKSVYVDEKEQLRKYEKKGKNAMHNNLNNDKKEHMKIEESKRKKQSVKTLIIMKKNS